MNAIEQFTEWFLDEKELQLARYLYKLLKDPDYFCSGELVADILPTYSEKCGDYYRTLDPDPIYRPLYYLHMYAGCRHFEDTTRIFLINASSHLEGCLLWLTKTPPRFRGSSVPFGGLVYELHKAKILSEGLANQLLIFNSLFNVPAKHMTTYFRPHSRLDERTFSCLDASLGFLAMRKLSIELFSILQKKGINLPHYWKEFDDNWLSPSWSSKR